MMRVMLIDEDNERGQILREGLEQAGHEVILEPKSTLNLARLVAELAPDVIIIDVDSPDRDMLEHLCVVTQDAPRPVVMFSADGDSAKIVDGLSAARVQPIIDVAIARFEVLQSLRNELADAQSELASRKQIERA